MLTGGSFRNMREALRSLRICHFVPLRSDPSPMCRSKSSARDHGDSVAAHLHWQWMMFPSSCEQMPCDALASKLCGRGEGSNATISPRPGEQIPCGVLVSILSCPSRGQQCDDIPATRRANTLRRIGFRSFVSSESCPLQKRGPNLNSQIGERCLHK
jgi:hypothetical protein